MASLIHARMHSFIHLFMSNHSFMSNLVKISSICMSSRAEKLRVQRTSLEGLADAVCGTKRARARNPRPMAPAGPQPMTRDREEEKPKVEHLGLSEKRKKHPRLRKRSKKGDPSLAPVPPAAPPPASFLSFARRRGVSSKSDTSFNFCSPFWRYGIENPVAKLRKIL